MGLFTNEFIDIIEWTDSSNDTLVWKFPRFQNEIKQNAQLTVRESQQAVFLNEGRIADVFTPGRYELNTKNIPILSTLMGWKYGFNSPFKADVFFVNTRQFLDQKWGTKNAITLSDERFGMFELRAFGTFAFRVTDAGKFLKEVTGTDSQYTTEEIAGQLRSLMVTKFTDAVGESKFPIEALAANLNDLSELVSGKLNADFDNYGLAITKFVIENVSMPDDVKKEIFEYSRLNKIDMQKLVQFKTANNIETIAANPGIGGTGISMGIGFSVGQMVTNAFSSSINIPPPLVQFFVAVNGQQAGPYTVEQLVQMAKQGQLVRETLVWRNGMSNWAAANTISDLDAVFANVPPPLV